MRCMRFEIATDFNRQSASLNKPPTVVRSPGPDFRLCGAWVTMVSPAHHGRTRAVLGFGAVRYCC